MRGGFRRRLIFTLVGLVAVTAAVLGTGAYVFVSASLHERLVRDSVAQARFDIEVLAAERLPLETTAEAAAESGIAEAFRRRGEAETLIDFGNGDPFVSTLTVRDALGALSPELRAIVARGNLGYQWMHVGETPYLTVGGRRPPDGPDIYVLFPATTVEDSLRQLAQALAVGGVLLALLAMAVAGIVARGVLRPVGAASRAAQRIEQGDLRARIRADGRDEFARWARSFNGMADSLEDTIGELRRTQDRQRRFVADVSHELRTPLTGLVIEAALIYERLDGTDPEVRRLSELLVGDVARLRALVGDLMEISRLDSAADKVVPSRIDLAHLLRSLVTARLPGAPLELPPGGLPVVTEPRRVERIVGNLLDNARDHAGGTVEVSAHREADEAVVRIADRGPGVAAADLARLFDRFFKADPSRSAGGSGLGLAIARDQASLLGGRLSAAPRAGGGLVFELRLPVDVMAVTGSLPGSDSAVTYPTDPEVRPERVTSAEQGDGT